jgi:hypothetical protein
MSVNHGTLVPGSRIGTMEDQFVARRTRARHIAFGACLAVNRRDIFDIFALWPLFLLGFGASKLLAPCCRRERRSGIWLVSLGSWFALNQFTVLRARDTWPLLLVLMGAMMSWEALSPVQRCPICREARHGR